MANLSNQQQSNLQNLQARQQTLLTDNAARNAALQFNATSQNQVNQFYDTLALIFKEQNAQRADAIAQFNLAETNKIEALNAKNEMLWLMQMLKEATAISINLIKH